MPDSQRGADTPPPSALRGVQIAQLRGWVVNDVVPPSVAATTDRVPRRTLPYPIAAVLVAREHEEDDAPISEAPASLTPRELARVLSDLAAHAPASGPSTRRGH